MVGHEGKVGTPQMSDEMEMADLRNALQVTQVELAKELGTTQAAVCRLEREPRNTRLGTLRRYVETLGGRVEVYAQFGDRVVRLTNLGTDRRKDARKKKRGR